MVNVNVHRLSETTQCVCHSDRTGRVFDCILDGNHDESQGSIMGDWGYCSYLSNDSHDKSPENWWSVFVEQATVLEKIKGCMDVGCMDLYPNVFEYLSHLCHPPPPHLWQRHSHPPLPSPPRSPTKALPSVLHLERDGCNGCRTKNEVKCILQIKTIYYIYIYV